MMVSSRLPIQLLLLTSLTFSFAQGKEEDSAAISFVNFANEPITLYWHGTDGERVDVGTLAPYEMARHATFQGHQFSYDNSNGERVNYNVVNEKDVHAIDIPSQLNVLCGTTKGDLHITVKPKWSPLGAARFLELVSNEHFTGCALNRVVKNFLTQFGISENYDQRTSFRTNTIPDDTPPSGVSFQPGYMAYAGSGPNSRTTEMFIVMPGTPPHQLKAFGKNPWETPFAYVDPEDVEQVVGNWYAYGDMPPWGNGPDPQQIYRPGGYVKYLKQNFPKMDYMETCQILDDNDMEEEL